LPLDSSAQIKPFQYIGAARARPTLPAIADAVGHDVVCEQVRSLRHSWAKQCAAEQDAAPTTIGMVSALVGDEAPFREVDPSQEADWPRTTGHSSPNRLSDSKLGARLSKSNNSPSAHAPRLMPPSAEARANHRRPRVRAEQGCQKCRVNA